MSEFMKELVRSQEEEHARHTGLGMCTACKWRHAERLLPSEQGNKTQFLCVACYEAATQ